MEDWLVRRNVMPWGGWRCGRDQNRWTVCVGAERGWERCGDGERDDRTVAFVVLVGMGRGWGTGTGDVRYESEGCDMMDRCWDRQGRMISEGR